MTDAQLLERLTEIGRELSVCHLGAMRLSDERELLNEAEDLIRRARFAIIRRVNEDSYQIAERMQAEWEEHQ